MDWASLRALCAGGSKLLQSKARCATLPIMRSLLALLLSSAALHAALTTTIAPDPWPNVAPFATTRNFDVERDIARRTPSAILNVYDIENDTLSVQSFTQPAHGSASANGDGTFTYTPASGYTGADSFAVTVSDGHGGTSITTMSARVIVPESGYATTRFVNMTDLSAGGATIDFGASTSTVPRVVDWNRDGLSDIIVGASGAVWLYLNTGTASTPVFAGGTRVQAAGVNISAGTGLVCVAWADFDGDGARDLAMTNTSNGKITYYRTTTTTGSIVLAAGVLLRNAANTADFVATDSRVDVADWNGDGKPDIITGSFSGNVQVAYNTSTGATQTFAAPVTALDTTGLTISGSYNLTPRVIDVSRDGVLDLLVAYNWGNIDFRANTASAAAPVLGSSAQLSVTLPDGSTPDLHALTDGPFVDLADFDGDGTFDLLIGGSIGGKVRFATGFAANTDLANLSATVAAHPTDLGTYLEGNATAKVLVQQQLASIYDCITTTATPSQVDAMTNSLEALITGYPQYFKAQTVNTTTHPRIPSLAAMLHLTMLKAKYFDPAHRTRVADAAVMTGAYRKLCTDVGLLYMENFLNPDGAEAIWQWVRFIPRDLYPGTGITQHESLDTRDYLVRGHLKNTFAGSGTSGGEFGFNTDARSVIGDRGSENFLMTVVHHEATHDLDAYVNSLPADFRRRWGQIIVRACGRDANGVNFIKEDPNTGWYSQTLTQAYWQTQGWWNGTDVWSTTLTNFFTTGLGAQWNTYGFMRGSSATFFLTSPQESLATQANQNWNTTEGRIQVALDRWQRGYDTNITEVLHFLDVHSKGANKMKFWENTDTNDQRISFAKLYRNAQGYIDGIDVNGRSYRFVVDSTGVVTAALPPKVNVAQPLRTQCSIPAGAGLWLSASATPLNLTPIASINWSRVSGPGTATFDNANTGITGVIFSAPGDYVLRCTASDGQFTGTADVNVRVGALHSPGWSTTGVGEPGEADGYTLVSGTYTITATGGGVSTTGTADKFLFISREFVGNADLTARIVSVQNVTGSSTCAGVMLRSTTASDAKHAFAEVGSTLSGAFIRRSTTAAASTSSSFTASAFPCWVRVRRIGTSISAWRAADVSGAPGTWTQIGSTQTIDLGSGAIEAGIAATSGSTYNPATIVVDNVNFSTVAANYGPQPSAGADQTIATLTANLAGSTSDDTLPAGTITGWQTLSGTNAIFGNSAALSTAATFSDLGTSTLRLIADDGMVRTFDDVTVTRVTPTNLWQLNHFTSAELTNSAICGPKADPDHDGIANAIEYFIGLNPRAAAQPGAALAQDFATVGVDKFLRISIAKNPAASDATCVAEVSNDLATWSTGQVVLEANTATQFIARDTVPLSGGAKRFIRLRVNVNW